MTDRQPTDTFAADRSAHQSTSLPGAATSAAGAADTPADELLPRAFGRYTLQRLLGRGGVGRVYLAHDPHLDRLVALKVPNPVEVAGWRERFLAEARAAATLTHPHVCPVYDVGEADGQPYLTMAYIEGETLAARLRRDGPLAPAAAVELVRTVARAMHEAHRRGIVHRDLKPANLMLDTAGRPVVMDFGLAIRSTSADDLRLTLTGVALGTPAYMPPEQASGEHDDIGPPSDVYSLGVILFELVTGRVPFKAKSFGKLLAQIERDAPPRPSSLNPAVDEALEAVILTALAKAPTDRFATAGDLADALDRYQQGDRYGLVSLYSKPYLIPEATGEYHPSPTTATAVPAKSRRRSWWLAGAAALLLAAVGGAIYVETDYGQIVVQLNDPNAKVDVKVNGQEVTLKVEGGNPIKVRAGKGQKLEVAGEGFETVADSFDLKRGDVHVARVTLKPKGDVAKVVPKPKDEPAPPDPKPKDPVVVDPKKEPTPIIPKKKDPPLPVPYPKEPTLIDLPGWQTLTDATKGEMEQWLGERKKAKHSVMWLDACEVAGKPVFSAVAALDDRAPKWTAMFDLTPDDVHNVAGLRKRIDTEAHHVASMCSYLQDEKIVVAMLWRDGFRSWALQSDVAEVALAGVFEQAVQRGQVVRLLRPFPTGEKRPRYSIYLEAVFKGAMAHQVSVTAEALVKFLADQRANGFRPRSVAAVRHENDLLFTALCEPNKEKWDWELDPNLTAVQMKSKAVELAGKGFRPSCVTAYPWDGAVRYCVVWVKEPPKPTPFPKEPTIVKQDGWETILDATQEQMKTWLDERKKAKHSVMWLDAVQVGDKPAFSAVAALDDRDANWTVIWDSPAAKMRNLT